jgi:hypothetical protein
MRSNRRIALTLFSALITLLPAAVLGVEAGKVIEDGTIDHAIVYAGSISIDQPVRIRLFDSTNADVGKTGEKKYAHVATMMKLTAPTSLMRQLIVDLKAGGFQDVSELAEGDDNPENAIVIEGEFTMLNPGSKAKRYWAGMGAGKSKTCVKGQVLDAGGEVLIDFDHCRIGAIGLFGGDAAKQMTTDAMRTGTRLGRFLVECAHGAHAGK